MALIGSRLGIIAQSAPAYPLDPLSAPEITAIVSTLKASGKTTDRSRFALIGPQEPSKAEMSAYDAGGTVRREAYAVVYERESNRTFGAVVDVAGHRVLSWKVVPGVQAPAFGEDFSLLSEIVQADPRWQAAIRKRGIADLKQVTIEPWAGAPGAVHRQMYAVSFLKGADRNYYAHPIEGLLVTVDMNTKQVLRVDDTGTVPIPKAGSEYEAGRIHKDREDPRPLLISQPDGPSFTITGHEVRWQNWRFRLGFDAKEGLVLYRVGYEDQGRIRSILYRGSLSEMFVPYGDPAPNWSFRAAFDQGEYGLGPATIAMIPGDDAPVNARYLSVTQASDQGVPSDLPNGIAIYERDGGILWHHTDPTDMSAEARRSRELVVQTITNLGNYDYAFQWSFHQDGTLEQQTVLTGILQTKGVPPAANGALPAGPDSFGTLVMPQVEAVYHQHFFCFRLDLDVDGATNCVKETNVESLPAGPANPAGNGMVVRTTALTSEKQAKRQLNPASARCWSVVNCAKTNALGQPVGYMLMPGESTVPFAQPGSMNRKRAGFIEAALWATRYDPSQRYAAGDYPNQNLGGEGLPAWIQADHPLENQDVVLWYTMGVTHIPRPEDWPVMPAHTLGFKLVPMGFFTHSPAVDVAPAH
jgi:primary-amine oxidase